MITVYTFLIVFCLFHQIIRENIILSLFILVLAVRVIFPFYYYSNYWEIPIKPDLLSSLGIVILFVTYKSFYVAKSKNTLSPLNLIRMPNRNFSVIYFIVLIVTILIFLSPAVVVNKPLPLMLALNGDYKSAHEVRVFISKETEIGVLIDLCLKLLFPVLMVLAGAHKAMRLKMLNADPMIVAMIVVFMSFLYFQKAAPLQLFIIYFLSSKIRTEIRLLDLTFLFLISVIIIFLMSKLYLDGAGGALKFQDLIFRRIGKTPTLVYLAYIDYGEKFGPEFLKHSFVLSKSASNPALPMLIYQHMEYGDSSSGWANGYFVGDLYVNFGYLGVILGSAFVGYVLSLTSRITFNAHRLILPALAWSFGSLFALSIPGNSFFAFSIFTFLLLFMLLYGIKSYSLRFGSYRLG